MVPILVHHPRVIWHTYPERIFAMIGNQGISFCSLDSLVTQKEDYENYILRDNPKIGRIHPTIAAMYLDECACGKQIALSLDGRENIFLFEGQEGDKQKLFALRARWEMVPHRKEFCWLLTMSEVPDTNQRYGWGACRPAGTHYHWDRKYKAAQT